MDEKNKSEARSGSARTLSVLAGVILLLVIIAVTRLSAPAPEFSLGDYSDADIAALEREFLETGSDETLIELLRALCYEAEVRGDKSAEITDAIAKYGTALFDRARAEETDLASLGDEAEMLELLGYIRDYGAG